MDAKISQAPREDGFAERIAQRLSSALSRGVIDSVAHSYLIRLSTHMVPPPAVPERAVFTIGMSGIMRCFYVDGRRMQHHDLIRRGLGPRHDADNTFHLLRKFRKEVDDLLDKLSGCPPEVAAIHARIEEMYGMADFPQRHLYEANMLGRAVQHLESRLASCPTDRSH